MSTIVTKKCKIDMENGIKPIKLFLTFYSNAVLFIITQYDKMGTFIESDDSETFNDVKT